MRAYVTLLSSKSYLQGVVVLNRSLVASGSRYPFYCVLSVSIDEETEQILRKEGIRCIRLLHSAVTGNINPLGQGFSHWNYTFDKLLIWGLTQFEKIVFLDCDMLVVRNIDGLFEHDPFSAVSAVVLAIGFAFMFSVKYDFSSASIYDAKSARTKKEEEKLYKYTPAERNACIALCLLYIGYMGVGIALGNWMPAYLQGKGFTGVEVSLPNTVGKFVQLAAYLLLPTIAAKLLKSIKATPYACALLIVSIVGIMLSTNLAVISVARGLMAALIGFISMHVQSDCAIVSPKKAGGKFSSTVLASANAGGVVAVLLMGFLPGTTAKLAMFIIFAVIGIAGSVMLIGPYNKISKEAAKASV